MMFSNHGVIWFLISTAIFLVFIVFSFVTSSETNASEKTEIGPDESRTTFNINHSESKIVRKQRRIKTKKENVIDPNTCSVHGLYGENIAESFTQDNSLSLRTYFFPIGNIFNSIDEHALKITCRCIGSQRYPKIITEDTEVNVKKGFSYAVKEKILCGFFSITKCFNAAECSFEHTAFYLIQSEKQYQSEHATNDIYLFQRTSNVNMDAEKIISENDGHFFSKISKLHLNFKLPQ